MRRRKSSSGKQRKTHSANKGGSWPPPPIGLAPIKKMPASRRGGQVKGGVALGSDAPLGDGHRRLSTSAYVVIFSRITRPDRPRSRKCAGIFAALPSGRQFQPSAQLIPPVAEIDAGGAKPAHQPPRLDITPTSDWRPGEYYSILNVVLRKTRYLT